MHPAEVVALGFDYPTPDRALVLGEAVESSLRGPAHRSMSRFLDHVGSIPLAGWEELHTSTLDLSPLFVPYVGHVQWGENYRRGEFMVELKRAMTELDIDLGGELPDHIAPVMRYLAQAADPHPELMQILPGVISRMRSTLKRAAPANPYRHALSAAVAVVEDTHLITLGGRS